MVQTYRLAADAGLRAAADHFAEHATMRNEQRHARNEGDPAAGYLHPAALARILANRAYLGEQIAGDLHNVANHRSLVSRAEWENAQREPTFRRGGNASYPLSGVATCEQCEGRMIGYGNDRYGRPRYI